MSARRFRTVCFGVAVLEPPVPAVPTSIRVEVEGGDPAVPPPAGVVFQRPPDKLWPELRGPTRGEDEAL